MDKLNTLPTPDSHADEWMSALFDGELDVDESRRALGRIGKDGDAARLWSEYSLIGDVMRGCQVERPELGTRIRAALAEEPTILAPMPAAPVANRPYYWMAAAAAVAAIAWSVLSVSPESGGLAIPVAANSESGMGDAASNGEVQAFLVAHQDYAYAVVGEPEMNFTRVSLVGAGQ